MMSFEISSLLVLDAIERQGSFAGAAKALGRVPSAVTYVVRKLEDDFGVLLFDRSGHRAVLTAAGRELLAEGRTLLQGADALQRRVRRVASGWETELRIAVDSLLRPEAVLRLVDAFLGEQAPTRLRLSSEVLGGTWDALMSGRAELGLACAELPPGGNEAAGFRSRELGQIEMVFAVSPEHPLATVAELLTPAMIRAYRAIAVADTSRSWPSVTVGLLSGQDVLTLASLHDKCQALVAGLGCGYMPRQLIERELASGALVKKETSEPMKGLRRYYIWNNAAKGHALQWFLDRLEDPEVRADLLG